MTTNTQKQQETTQPTSSSRAHWVLKILFESIVVGGLTIGIAFALLWFGN
jgi:hypothetical protein